jgi:co-chaperonin GroES (HSP10)
MEIKPFGNQILIEPIEKEQVLVQQKATLCEYGKVLAIGDDVQNVKVGDVIAFLVWGVNFLEIDDKIYHFVAEDPRFILGKITMPGDMVT